MSDIQDLNNTDLETILKTFIGDKTISVKISNEQLQILTVLLDSSPDFFKKIDEHLKKILEDNVIDINDLPEFILLITDILNTDFKSFKKLQITRGDAVNIIEAIVYLLIEQDVIKTGDQKQMYLILLKLSLKMINTKINLNKTITCFQCI